MDETLLHLGAFIPLLQVGEGHFQLVVLAMGWIVIKVAIKILVLNKSFHYNLNREGISWML
jgi:hypothetical protein